LAPTTLPRRSEDIPMEAEHETTLGRMAPMSVIARELGVGVYALRRIVDRLYREGACALAYTKTAKGSFMYDVEAIKVAVAPHLAELRAKWATREAKQARSAQRQAEARIEGRAERMAANAKAVWGKHAPKKRTTVLPSQAPPSRRPEPLTVARKRRTP
jgi:hypothetical protein